MGYNRWRPPVFYFSSMVAAGGDVLAVTSSTSAYPRHLEDIRGGFFLCLHVAATRASMADGVVADTGGARAVTMPVPPCSLTSRRGASRHSSSSCIGEANCETTCWLSVATATDGLGKVGGEASCLAHNCRARRATQTAFMSENYSSSSSDAAERVDKMVEGGAWPVSCS